MARWTVERDDEAARAALQAAEQLRVPMTVRLLHRLDGGLITSGQAFRAQLR